MLQKPFQIIALSVLCFGFISAQDPVEIETKSGKIIGTVRQCAGKPVNVFMGVPYAAPPVGPLRFAKPKNPEPWAEPKECNKPPPMCPQIDPNAFAGMGGDAEKSFDPEKELAGKTVIGGALHIPMEYKDASLGQDEDCLTMNVFQPTGCPNGPLPIVIYVPGGFFLAGGSSIPTYDFCEAAAFQCVIYVVVQYRLSVLGFLHSGTDEIPGNMGLWDIDQAVTFMSENAEAFGGNPKNVIPMGTDSGGWAVGFMILKKECNPAVERAIMMSGSPLCPLMLFGESASIARFEKYMGLVGCPLGEKGEKDEFAPVTPENIECLRGKTLEEILNAQAELLKTKKDAGFMPTEDKRFFDGNPFDVIKDPKAICAKCMLMGTNSNEGGMLLASGMKDIYPPIEGEPQPVTLNDLVEKAKEKSKGQEGAGGGNAGQMQMMLPMFFRGVDKKDPEQVRNRLLQLAADFLFVCPDMLFVQAANKGEGCIYYYRFDFKPSKSYWAPWLKGAQHGDELQYVAGMTLKEKYADHYPDNEKKMGENILKLWGNFMTKGDPTEGKLKWKPTQGKTKAFLTIKVKKCKVENGFPKNSCKDLTRYYSMGRSFLKTYKA